MKNSLNQYSVEPVSFECIDKKNFRFGKNDPIINLKRRFLKKKNFEKSWSSGLVGSLGRPLGMGEEVIQLQKTNKLVIDVIEVCANINYINYINYINSN